MMLVLCVSHLLRSGAARRFLGGKQSSAEACISIVPDEDKHVQFMLDAFAGTLDPRVMRALQQQA